MAVEQEEASHLLNLPILFHLEAVPPTQDMISGLVTDDDGWQLVRRFGIALVG